MLRSSTEPVSRLALMRCEKRDTMRTMDMHPSVLQLQCAIDLYIIYPITKTLSDGCVQDVTKPGLGQELGGRAAIGSGTATYGFL